MKRPAAASTASAKKAKVASETQVAAAAQKALQHKCKLVASVLLKEKCDFPKSVLHMLADNLDNFLAVAKEERHEFQVQAIDMVKQVFAQCEASVLAKVQVAEAKAQEADTEKATRDASAEVCQELAKEKTEAAEAAATAASEATKAFHTAQTAKNHAVKEQKTGDQNVNAMAEKKAVFESLITEALATIWATGSEECAEQLCKVGQECFADATLLSSLPSAAAKAPESRGSFDDVVLHQAEAAVKKRIEELCEALAQAEPARQERSAKVAEAEAALQAATVHNEAAQEALAAAQAAHKAADAELKAANKAVKQFQSELKFVKVELQGELQAKTEFDEKKTALAELEEHTHLKAVPEAAPAAEAPAADQ